MKRFLVYIYAIVMLFSCGRTEVPNNPDTKSLSTVQASISESLQTKAHLEGDSIIKWDMGEQIGVFSNTNGAIAFTRKGDSNTFTGDTPLHGDEYYAFSPYFKDVYNSKTPHILHYNAGINMTAGGKNPVVAIPMIAKSNGSSFSFKLTCGVLHFPITGTEKLKSATLKGNSDEPLPRNYTIDLDAEQPILTRVWDSSKEMKFTPTSPVQLSESEPYDVYFILPPMSFSDGFSLILDYEGTPVTIKNEKEVTIQRASILNYSIDVDEVIEEETDIPGKERNALVAIYNALGGPKWTHKENWCSNRPLSEWYGVRTDGDDRVYALELENNNLAGYLPEDIGQLRHLEQLYLGNGESDNGEQRLNGPLPESIRDLVRLKYLYLGDFDFSCEIPEWFKELKQLRWLRLPRCHLTGSIPDLSSLPDLEILNLADNQLNALPSYLEGFSHLQSLDLRRNRFSGEINADFRKLTYLKDLYLSDNEFGGPVPECASSLRTVYLYNNQFSGPLPSSYASMLDNKDSDNTSIWIHTNNMSGPLPDAIFNHPNFSEYADQILRGQREGYKFNFDETKVPACKRVFKTLEGGTLDLGAQYAKADYTMIVRWAEWCPYAYIFTPQAIKIARKYKEKGLQTIWAYGGGIERERLAYMSEIGLDQFSPHIIESFDSQYFNTDTDHAVWRVQRYSTPFVEVVDREGHILFIDDSGKNYSAYSFSHTRDELADFIAKLLGEVDDDLYESVDYSADGNVHTLQTATEGHGIDVVLMGDAYSDRLIADGTYRNQMERAAKAFFSEVPYASFKDHFNVYYVDVVSKNETCSGETAFSTQFGEGTNIKGNDDKVYTYANKAISESRMANVVVIVIINENQYAGTTSMRTGHNGDYGCGPSIAYCPAILHEETFVSIVSHEAGGHGFAKLADEYSYGGTIDEETKATQYEAMVPYGWWKNIDFTNVPQNVKWSDFINDSRYNNEGIGVFEGAATFSYGIWRPTMNSIMNDSLTGFNAPGRFAIWYRIGKLAYGPEWSGNYADFVRWDLAHRSSSANAPRTQSNYVEKRLPHLGQPHVSWK